MELQKETGDVEGVAASPFRERAITGYIDDIRRGLVRRRSGSVHLYSQMEAAMRQIFSNPLLCHDAHCQNLFARIARAGSPDEFAARLTDLHFHISRLADGRGGANASSRRVDGFGSTVVAVGCGDDPDLGSDHAVDGGRARRRLFL